MQNITFSEWTEETAKAALQLRTRWPWLRIDADHQQLNIAAPSCSGLVCLRGVKDERHMEARPMLGSSGALSSDTRVARAQIMEATAVCDALDVAKALLGTFQVWMEGSCPCDMCGGRGNTRGTPCKHCDGKGVR